MPGLDLGFGMDLGLGIGLGLGPDRGLSLKHVLAPDWGIDTILGLGTGSNEKETFTMSRQRTITDQVTTIFMNASPEDATRLLETAKAIVRQRVPTVRKTKTPAEISGIMVIEKGVASIVPSNNVNHPDYIKDATRPPISPTTALIENVVNTVL